MIAMKDLYQYTNKKVFLVRIGLKYYVNHDASRIFLFSINDEFFFQLNFRNDQLILNRSLNNQIFLQNNENLYYYYVRRF